MQPIILIVALFQAFITFGFIIRFISNLSSGDLAMAIISMIVTFILFLIYSLGTK